MAGATATEAVVAVINHQRRAESDLDVLRTLTDATAAAASGIDRLLRTFLLAVARAGEPTVAGGPIAELPGAVLAGRVPIHVVIADIQARVALFTVGADAVVGGIGAILQILNRSTAGLDTEPYPADTRTPGHATLTPSRSDLAAGPDGTGIVTTVEHEHDDHRPTEKPPATAATTAPGPIESASARIVPTPTRSSVARSRTAMCRCVSVAPERRPPPVSRRDLGRPRQPNRPPAIWRSRVTSESRRSDRSSGPGGHRGGRRRLASLLAHRRDLADALRAHQASTPDAVARARADLEDDADAVDATPGILLPADRAETSPHLPGAEH